MQDQKSLAKVVEYMKSHWPSHVKPEWQVGLAEYPQIIQKVLANFTTGKTMTRHLFRIAGLSGSGKTTQILPAVEAHCDKRKITPVLVAARRFVEYHPHYQDILNEYGEQNLRKMTDEFSTIMMFMTLKALTDAGYDIILDVTLLDPEIEGILIQMLEKGNYKSLLLMIATSPIVTEHFLEGRAWRHSRETEKEFIRATSHALAFYAETTPEIRIILWSVYGLNPIYDGPVSGCLDIFADYSSRETLPARDDAARASAKISYLTSSTTDLS